MKGRVLVWPLVFLLVLGLVGQTFRWRNRLLASRLLRQVDLLSTAAVSAGKASPQLMASNLEALRRAAPLAPAEMRIALAQGTQYLFLTNLDAAIRSYEEALALDPRPEGYLFLGRARWLAGEKDEARRSVALAVRLDPRLAHQVPLAAR